MNDNTAVQQDEKAAAIAAYLSSEKPYPSSCSSTTSAPVKNGDKDKKKEEEEEEETPKPQSNGKEARPPGGGGSSSKTIRWPFSVTTVITYFVGLVAILFGVFIHNTERLPNPQPGVPINNQSPFYRVNTGWIKSFETKILPELKKQEENKFGKDAYAAKELRLAAAASKLAQTFVQSSVDGPLLDFLEQSATATTSGRYGKARMVLKIFLFRFLQKYAAYSRPEASGAVRKADLYVASTQQFRTVLQVDEVEQQQRQQGSNNMALLDIGSGTGSETVKLAKALGMSSTDANLVHCLETSKPHQKRLQQRGYNAYERLPPETFRFTQFGVVSLLNVLDRCDAPHSVVDLAIRAISESSSLPDNPNDKKKKPKLLVAIVLPFSGFVAEGKYGLKWGKSYNRKPEQPFRIDKMARHEISKIDNKNKGNNKFELDAILFLETLMREHNDQLELTRWTKLPYVSSGNMRKTHFVLDIAIMAFDVIPAAAAATPPTITLPDGSNTANTTAATKVAPNRPPPILPDACQKRKANSDPIYSWLASTVNNHKQQQISKENGDSWGSVLDAGGGFGSLCWLLQQNQYEHLTEVTAETSGIYGSNDLTEAIESMNSKQPKSSPSVIVEAGNWKNPEFLQGKTYDVVVADYLLGAVEMHWPHGADGMMDRLLQAVKPNGGYLLIVGLEPYENVLHWNHANLPADRLVLDIEAIGESAAFVAGLTTYREMPQSWTLRQLDRVSASFRVVDKKRFRMKLTASSLQKQISYAYRMAAAIDDENLRNAYESRILKLNQDLSQFKSQKGNIINPRGRNYAFVVQRL